MDQIKYDQVVDLDEVTLQDCLNMYEKRGLVSVINDSRVVNFEEDKD